MMYPQKKQIERAILNVFSAPAKVNYLQKSSYRLKKTWLEGIEKANELSRYFNPQGHLSPIQHLNYTMLCMCELEECSAHVENEEIKEYFRLLNCWFSNNVSGKNAKILELLNKREVRLMKSLTPEIASKEDIRNFLKMSMLLGDKSYIYDLETKDGLSRLCEYIAA